MVLIRVSEGSRVTQAGPVENRGDLVYKLVNADANIPLVMQDVRDPKPKVMGRLVLKHPPDYNKMSGITYV